MKAGALRHRVTIQRLVTTRDSFGAALETRTDIATVWASVEPIGGRELWQMQQVTAEVSTRVRMRYRSDVVPTMRLCFGSRILEVTNVIDTEERHRELELLCREIVP